ncbi:hypothetical protein ACNKHX_25260 [Shigella flexneri]
MVFLPVLVTLAVLLRRFYPQAGGADVGLSHHADCQGRARVILVC